MTTTAEICARIRAIRISKGLSLSEVEIQSDRTLRAVVLGSYERGDRTLSVKKAITIADFYGVPLSYLLEPPRADKAVLQAPVIDLRRIRTIMADPQHLALMTPNLRTMIRFIGGIVELRNDWNGELLSMRLGDLTALAMAVGASHEEMWKILNEKKILLLPK